MTRGGSTPRRSATRCWPSAASCNPHRPIGSVVLDVPADRDPPRGDGRIDVTDIRPARRRRSVYLPIVRDVIARGARRCSTSPTPSVVTGQRDVTTVAAQALFLMNSPFVSTRPNTGRSALAETAAKDDAARVRPGLPARPGPRPHRPPSGSRAIAYVGNHLRNRRAIESPRRRQEPTRRLGQRLPGPVRQRRVPLRQLTVSCRWAPPMTSPEIPMTAPSPSPAATCCKIRRLRLRLPRLRRLSPRPPPPQARRRNTTRARSRRSRRTSRHGPSA